MLHLRPVKIWRHYELRHYPLCWFLPNDDNQVNIGDSIEDIMISEYHTIHHGTCICRKFCPDACPRLHVVLQVITARCTLVQSAVLRSHVVCLSVTLVDCDHIGWNSSKLISPLVSLGRLVFATPT